MGIVSSMGMAFSVEKMSFAIWRGMDGVLCVNGVLCGDGSP
jgi:hypothetical protein